MDSALQLAFGPQHTPRSNWVHVLMPALQEGMLHYEIWEYC